MSCHGGLYLFYVLYYCFLIFKKWFLNLSNTVSEGVYSAFSVFAIAGLSITALSLLLDSEGSIL